jgi:hypothetical protein
LAAHLWSKTKTKSVKKGTMDTQKVIRHNNFNAQGKQQGGDCWLGP